MRLTAKKNLIISSKGNGEMSFYAGVKTDEFWVRDSGVDFKSKTQLLDWFKKEYSEWVLFGTNYFNTTTLISFHDHNLVCHLTKPGKHAQTLPYLVMQRIKCPHGKGKISLSYLHLG